MRSTNQSQRTLPATRDPHNLDSPPRRYGLASQANAFLQATGLVDGVSHTPEPTPLMLRATHAPHTIAVPLRPPQRQNPIQTTVI